MSQTSHEAFTTAEELAEIVLRCRFTSEGCWIWLGSTQFEAPYFEYKDQEWNPQIVLFEIKYDREMVNVDRIIAHCHNTHCCNPSHVELYGDKTQVEFGHKTTRITPFEVQSIRQDYATGAFTMRQLQDKYGLKSSGYISDLINNKKGTKYQIPEIPTSSAVLTGKEQLARMSATDVMEGLN